VTCERFATGASPLHGADPRVKLLVAASFSLAIALLSHIEAQALALLGGAGLAASARLSPLELARRLGVVNVFVLALWAILPWTTTGATAAQLGALHITREGLALSLAVTLKCNAIVLANMALLSTSTVFSLAHALAHLGCPPKLVQLFFFSWRYLHVLEEEYAAMSKTVRARGFVPRTDLHTYRTYAHLFGTLLIKSYDRGERVYKAMLCRGFTGTFWLLSHFHLHRKDLVLAAAASLFISAVAGLDVLGPWR